MAASRNQDSGSAIYRRAPKLARTLPAPPAKNSRREALVLFRGLWEAEDYRDGVGLPARVHSPGFPRPVFGVIQACLIRTPVHSRSESVWLVGTVSRLSRRSDRNLSGMSRTRSSRQGNSHQSHSSGKGSLGGNTCVILQPPFGPFGNRPGIFRSEREDIHFQVEVIF